MSINPFRGGYSTTPDYWPSQEEVSDSFVDYRTEALQSSLNYFDALNFLKDRRSANDFLIQRQQEMEEQGAFVHPEEKWTAPVDASERIKADEEYRNALIGIRKRYENSKGVIPDNIREAEFEQNKAKLEEWYKSRTTAHYKRPAYENTPQQKRQMAWEDAKTENPSDYALDHAANDQWGQNDGVRNYRKFLFDRIQSAEENGRRDLAHKYLEQLYKFDPSRRIYDANDPVSQKRASEFWDAKAQKDRFAWESQKKKKASARKAAETLKNDTNLLELLNEALAADDELFFNYRDRFNVIKDSYGSDWTYDHTVAWDAMVAKAFRNKRAASKIQEADPRIANEARRVAQSKNQRINERRKRQGKQPLPLSATDIASNVENIYRDFPDQDPSAFPPRPDESNFVAPTETRVRTNPRWGFETKYEVPAQTLEEAQAEWDAKYKNRALPKELEDRLRPVSVTIQADRAFSSYVSEADPSRTGYEGFQADQGQPPASRIEYLTRFIMAKNPEYSPQVASQIAERAIETNKQNDEKLQELAEQGENAVHLARQSPQEVSWSYQFNPGGTMPGGALFPDPKATAANKELLDEQTDSRTNFEDGVEELRQQLLTVRDYHQLAALDKVVAKTQTDALWNAAEKAKAFYSQEQQFEQDYIYPLDKDGNLLTDKPMPKLLRHYLKHGKPLRGKSGQTQRLIKEYKEFWESVNGFSHFGKDPKVQQSYGTAKQKEFSKDNLRGQLPQYATRHQWMSIVKMLEGDTAEKRAERLAWTVLNDPLVRVQQAILTVPLAGGTEMWRLLGVDDKVARTVGNDILSAPLEAFLNVATAAWSAAANVEEIGRQNPDGWLRDTVVNALVETTNSLSESSAMLGEEVYGENIAGWTNPIRSGFVSLGQIAIYTAAGVPWYAVTGGYFSQSYAQSYHEARQMGLKGKAAVEYGVAMGAAEAIPEIAGAYLQMKFGFGGGFMKFLLPGQKTAIRAAVRDGWANSLKSWMPVIKGLLIQAPETFASEQVQEFFTLLMQTQARVMYGIEPNAFDPVVFVKKAFDTFLSTSVAAFGGATAIPAVQYKAAVKTLAKNLKVFTERVKDINIDAIKTMTRDEYQQFLYEEYQKIIETPLFKDLQVEEYVDLLEKIYDYSQQNQETPGDWFAELFVQMFPGQAQLIVDGNASRNSFKEAFLGNIPLGLENAAARTKFQADLKTYLQKLDDGILAERRSLAVGRPEITSWYVPIEEFYTEQETYTDENGIQRTREVQRRRELHVQVRAGSMDEASDIVNRRFENDPNRNVTSRTDQAYQPAAEGQGTLFDLPSKTPSVVYTADATLDQDTNLPVAQVDEVEEQIRAEFGDQASVRMLPADERRPNEFLEWFTGMLNESGIGVQLFTVEGTDKKIGGFFHKGTVYIDPTSVKKGESAWGREVVLRLMSHEGIGHGLAETHPELARYLTEQAWELADAETKRRAGLSLPSVATRSEMEAILKEEVLARVLEKEFSDIAAGRFKGDQNMLRRLASWVKSTLARLNLLGLSKETRKFRKDIDSIVRQLFAGKTLQDLEVAGIEASTEQGSIGGRLSVEPTEAAEGVEAYLEDDMPESYRKRFIEGAKPFIEGVTSRPPNTKQEFLKEAHSRMEGGADSSLLKRYMVDILAGKPAPKNSNIKVYEDRLQARLLLEQLENNAVETDTVLYRGDRPVTAGIDYTKVEPGDVIEVKGRPLISGITTDKKTAYKFMKGTQTSLDKKRPGIIWKILPGAKVLPLQSKSLGLEENEHLALGKFKVVSKKRNKTHWLIEVEHVPAPTPTEESIEDVMSRELGDAQRGAPEDIMVQAQMAMGGGVYGSVIEHVGDLTNRMSQKNMQGYDVMNKINRNIRYLENDYGFLKEHEENMAVNAPYYDRTPAEQNELVDSLLSQYADAHRKLPVFNRAQELARDAAVALGEKNPDKALSLLKELKELLPTEEGEGIDGSRSLQEFLKQGDINYESTTPTEAATEQGVVEGRLSVEMRDLEEDSQTRRDLANARKVKPTGKKGVTTIKDAYTAVVRKKTSYTNSRSFNAAVDRVTEMVVYQMEQEDSGLGWYNKDIQKSFKITSQLFPELRRKHDRQMFTIIAAVLSNGQEAVKNWQDAAYAYDMYRSEGRIPRRRANQSVYGTKGNTIAVGLGLIEHLINTKGEKGAIKWLFSSHPLSELREVRRGASKDMRLADRSFTKTPVNAMYTDTPNMALKGKAEDMYSGAHIFGPKVGSFLLNLNGLEETTIDMWAMRTFGREFGTIFEGQINPETGLHEAPTEQERPYAKKLFEEVGKRLNIAPQDAQAVAWFAEKQLAAALGAPAQTRFFSEGATKYVEQPGNESRRRQATPVIRGGRDGTLRLDRKLAKPKRTGQLTRDIGRASVEVAEQGRLSVEPYEDLPEGWEHLPRPEKIKSFRAFVKRFVEAQPDSIQAILKSDEFLYEFRQNEEYNKAVRDIITKLVGPNGKRFTVPSFKKFIAEGNDHDRTNLDTLVVTESEGVITWDNTNELWDILTQWAVNVPKGERASLDYPEFKGFFAKSGLKMLEQAREIVQRAYDYADNRGIPVEPPPVDYWNLVEEYREEGENNYKAFDDYIKSIGEEGQYIDEEDTIFGRENREEAEELGAEINFAYRSIQLLRNAKSDQDLARLRQSYFDWLVLTHLATQLPVGAIKEHRDKLNVRKNDAAYKYLEEIQSEVVAEVSVFLADNESESPTTYDSIASKLELQAEQITADAMMFDENGNYANLDLNGALLIARSKYEGKTLSKAEWMAEMKKRFPHVSKAKLQSQYEKSQNDANYIFSPDRTGAYNKRLRSVNQSRASSRQKTRERASITQMAALKRQLRREARLAKAAHRQGAAEAKRKTAEHYKEKIQRIRDEAKRKKKVSDDLRREYDAVLRGMGATSAKFTATLPKSLRRPNFTKYEQFVKAATKVAELFERYQQAQAQNDLRNTLVRLFKDKNFVYGDKAAEEIRKLLAPVFAERKRFPARRKSGKTIGIIPGKITQEMLEKTGQRLFHLIRNAQAELEKEPDTATAKALLDSIKKNRALLDRLAPKPIEALTEDQAVELRNILLSLQAQSRLKNKLEGKQRKKNYEQIRNEFIETVSARFKQLGKTKGRTDISEEEKESIFKIWSNVNMLNPRTMMDFMTGGEVDSEFARITYHDLDQGQDAVFADINEDTDYLLDSLRAVGIDVNTAQGVNALMKMSMPYAKRSFVARLLRKSPQEAAIVDTHKIKLSDGKTLEITPAERMSLLMHFQDPDTYSLIIQGTPINIGRSGGEGDTYVLSTEDITSIMDLFAGKRDKEQEIADFIMARINGTMRQSMQAYSLEQKGIDITKDTMYFPRVRAKFVREMEEEKDALAAFNNYTKKLFDNVGITKERVADTTSAIAIQDAFTVFRNHSMMVSGLRNVSGPLNNLYRLLNDDAVAGKLRTLKGGYKLKGYYERRIGALANDFLGMHARSGVGIPDKSWDTIIRKGVRFVTLNALGLNFRVAGMQVASISTAMSQIPSKHVLLSAKAFYNLRLNNEIYEHDPYLRSRATGSGVGILSEGEGTQRQHPLIQSRGAFDSKGGFSVRGAVSTKGNVQYAEVVMSMIRGMDAAAIRVIWASSKTWVESEGKYTKGSAEYWAEVSKRARNAVKVSQPTTDSMHMSGIALQSKTDLAARLLSMYQAQRNKNYNMQVQSALKLFKRKGQTREALTEFLFHTAGQQFAVSTIRVLYAAAVTGGLASMWAKITGSTPPDDDEGWLDWIMSLISEISYESVMSLFTELPLSQYLVAGLENLFYSWGWLEKKPFDASASPFISSIDASAKSLITAAKIINDSEGKTPVIGDEMTGDESLVYRSLAASQHVALAITPSHPLRELGKAYRKSQKTHEGTFRTIYNDATDLAKKKMAEATTPEEKRYARKLWNKNEGKDATGYLRNYYKKQKIDPLIRQLNDAKKAKNEEKVQEVLLKLNKRIRAIKAKIALFETSPKAFAADYKID